jgi:hypothetical protein
MRYLKVYESFILDENEMKFEIDWVTPDDKTILSELHELINNMELFFKPDNFDRVYAKIPSVFHYVVKNYLKKETTDKEEIKKLLLNKNPESLGFGNIEFKKDIVGVPDKDGIVEGGDPTCIKEVSNFIKSCSVVTWKDVDSTGNMGDLTKIFGSTSGKGGWKGSFQVKNKGIKGIEELKSALPTCPIKADVERYLITYDDLIKNNGKISLPTPFVINLKDNQGNDNRLIGGHKRSTIALQLGIPVQVLFIKF